MSEEPSPNVDKPAKSFAKASEAVPPPAAMAQTMVNVRTWLPFLQNPTQRNSLVRYASREKRDSGTWRIGLPTVCWKCQTTDGLKARKISRVLRSFESAIPIAIAGTTFTAIQFVLVLITLVSGNFFLMSIFACTGSLTAIASGAMLFLKSWTEDVKLTLHTCPKCEADFRGPDMGTDQEELHLFLPTPELAALALAEQKAERRSKKGGASEPAAAASGDEARPKKKKAKNADGTDPPASPPAIKHVTPDLPPIGLDDAPAPIPTKPLKPTLKPAPKAPPAELPPIKLDD